MLSPQYFKMLRTPADPKLARALAGRTSDYRVLCARQEDPAKDAKIRAAWAVHEAVQARFRRETGNTKGYMMRLVADFSSPALVRQPAPARQLTPVDRHLTGRRLAEVAAFVAAGRDIGEAITRSRLGEMRSRAIMHRNMLR